MRFTLLYEGPLPSTGKPADKHAIRRSLHPQLKNLWKHRPLSLHQDWIRHGESPDHGVFLKQISSHEFASTVNSHQRLYAELDILMLRPQSPGSVIIEGDIDNQLKTLFDALRIPNKQEIPSEWQPSDEEKPLHCLLEDDSLITRVNVETAQLLTSNEGPLRVHAVIRVDMRAFTATYGNLSLLT